ncbi:MAG: hypothetical protein AAF721_15920 [Myxococcota bacterium]
MRVWVGDVPAPNDTGDTGTVDCGDADTPSIECATAVDFVDHATPLVEAEYGDCQLHLVNASGLGPDGTVDTDPDFPDFGWQISFLCPGTRVTYFYTDHLTASGMAPVVTDVDLDFDYSDFADVATGLLDSPEVMALYFDDGCPEIPSTAPASLVIQSTTAPDYVASYGITGNDVSWIVYLDADLQPNMDAACYPP